MARAYNIHLVTVGDHRLPVAAFTVKREAQTWLKKNGTAHMDVFKLRDGGFGDVTAVSVTELELD